MTLFIIWVLLLIAVIWCLIGLLTSHEENNWKMALQTSIIFFGMYTILLALGSVFKYIWINLPSGG